MAFGFPAYHEDEVSHKGVKANDLRRCITEALVELTWIADEDDDLWFGNTGMNLLSYGETIRIERHAGGLVTICSECKMPTQCFDWGRNKRNVNLFFDTLEDYVAEVRS